MYTALVAARVLDGAVAQSEEGVVLAAANIFTRMEMGAMLTHDDVARGYCFTSELLAAQALSA